MTEKLKELMELSNAVDVICKSVAKDNAEKQKLIDIRLEDKWNKMWEDIVSILPALEVLRPKNHYVHIGKYEYGYPYGWNAMGANGITFIIDTHNPIAVYMDKSGGWEQMGNEKSDFDYWMRHYKPCIEMLLNEWPDMFPKIQADLERRIAENIKNRIKTCEQETKKLDEKLAR